MIDGPPTSSPDWTTASGLPWPAWGAFEHAVDRYRHARYELSYWAGICHGTEAACGPGILDEGHLDDMEKLRRVRHWKHLFDKAAADLADEFITAAVWGRA